MSVNGSGVYCITHIETSKKYVGSSVNLNARLKKHLRMLKNGKHHSYKLQMDWNKYGEEAFEISILLRCPVDSLLDMEQKIIDKLNVINEGYNVALFANAPHKGRTHTPETLAKMSEAHKGRKPISEETRERMREASVKREAKKKAEGFVVSDETKAKLVAKLTGRPVSAETRAKMSANHKGNQLTAEQREKQIAALTGRTLSDEHRAAITAGNLKRWAEERGEL